MLELKKLHQNLQKKKHSKAVGTLTKRIKLVPAIPLGLIFFYAYKQSPPDASGGLCNHLYKQYGYFAIAVLG
jgi:hypothetical protein